MSKIQSTKDKFHENVIICLMEEFGWDYVSREKGENDVLKDTLVFYDSDDDCYNKISTDITLHRLVYFIKCHAYEQGRSVGKLDKAGEIKQSLKQFQKALYINEDL